MDAQLKSYGGTHLSFNIQGAKLLIKFFHSESILSHNQDDDLISWARRAKLKVLAG